MGNHKDRYMHSLQDLASSERFQILNNSLDNMINGVVFRIFRAKINGKYVEVPRPKPGHVKKQLQKFKADLLRFRVFATPIPLEEIPGRYVGAKRLNKERAVTNVRNTGYLDKYRYCSIFVKGELYNITRKAIGDIVSRIIQPGSQEHIVSCAQYILPVEHNIYRAIDKVVNQYNPIHPSPSIMSGFNVVEQANHVLTSMNGFKRPCWRGADASRYDQCISEDMMRWEQSVMCEFVNNPLERKAMKKLLRGQIITKCFGKAYDGSIKYSARGTRKSGQQDTALGNKLDMIAMWVSFLVDNGVTKFALKCAGDDILICLEESEWDRIKEDTIELYFKDLGFRLKMEPRAYEPEHIEFCQMKIVWDGIGYRMVRDPKVAIAKDCYSVKKFESIVEYCGWVDSVGKCGLALCSGIPMMQSFYLALIRGAHNLKQKEILGKGITKKYKRDEKFDYWNSVWARGLKSRAREITAESRISFFKAFNILPDVQIEMEQAYDDYELEYNGLDKFGEVNCIPFHDYH